MGAYTLTIGGYEDVAPDGEDPGYQAYPLQWSLPITVSAALAETGVSNPWMGYAAGGLIVSGAGMVLYSRRLTK